MSMNSCNQRFNINKQTKRNPFIYQNYAKSKIMKNLARTLSLFLIFSENYYKSQTWNIMTELCYERWFTTQTNDKVLIKQTKNQNVLTVVQGKSLLSIQNTLLTRSCLLFNFLALQDPWWLLYVHFKSSSSYYWTWQCPGPWVFKQKPSWFVSFMVQCSKTGTM